MNLGFSEMLFIFILAMIIFGPKKLPEIGRQIGKALSEFKRASNDFKSQLETELRQMELEEALKKEKENISEMLKPPSETVAATGMGSGYVLSPATGEALATESITATSANEHVGEAPNAEQSSETSATTESVPAAPASSETASGDYVTVHPSPWDDAANADPEVAGFAGVEAPGSGEASAQPAEVAPTTSVSGDDGKAQASVHHESAADLPGGSPLAEPPHGGMPAGSAGAMTPESDFGKGHNA